MAVNRNIAKLFSGHSNFPHQIDFHGVGATLVPRGNVINAGRGTVSEYHRGIVDSFYLTAPLRYRHVESYLQHTEDYPLVQFGMTPKDEIIVVKKGNSLENMNFVKDLLSNENLQPGDVAFVGHAHDPMSGWRVKYSPAAYAPFVDSVISGLNFFQLSAMAAFFNDQTLAASSLQWGAATIMSRDQLHTASATNLFSGDSHFPGMPIDQIAHWTSDLADRNHYLLSAHKKFVGERVLEGDQKVRNRKLTPNWPVPTGWGTADPSHMWSGRVVSRLAVALVPQDLNP